MTKKKRIIVVDDEEFVRESMVEILRAEGWDVQSHSSGRDAVRTIARDELDVVVSDLRMPGGDGLSLLVESKRLKPNVPVVLLTGAGSIETAVSAMKSGAYDFVTKPIDPEQLVRLVRRALEHRDLVSEVVELRKTVGILRDTEAFVGRSAPYQRLKNQISQVAKSNATVLVTGESGTGKELVALDIHRQSARSSKNLVCVNCAAITDALFESEFFGHRKGSFTSAVADRAGRFAEAHGGTLVLDEIGTLKLEMQAKLLRVLETGEYQIVGDSKTQLADVRVIAITNEDLAAQVKDGNFRADLYYRLAIFPIEVPPLRGRKEDIVPIAEHFLERLRYSQPILGGTSVAHGLSAEAAQILSTYDWPGNVRELRNVLERAMLLSGTNGPDPAVLREILFAGSAGVQAPLAENLNLRLRTDTLERELIIAALGRTGGKKREAAAMLGIDPRNFGYYLRKHALGDGKP